MPKSKLKLDANFNMSSMTDIVFLLLIFFMLTSNFVTPAAVEINVPTSNTGIAAMPKLTITIKEEKFYVNKQEVTIGQMKDELKSILTNSGDREVVLHADEKTPIDKIIQVMDIGHDLGIKVQLAVNNK